MNEPRVQASEAQPWWRRHPYQAGWLALLPVLFVLAAVTDGFVGIWAAPLMLPGMWFGVLRVYAMLNPTETFDHNGRMR
ncbi:MAG: hypothetical protein ACT4QG_13545 [Sporichthyaceae bacterium]